MATQDDYIRTALRVPPRLHAQIHEAARGNNRTFNAEIVARLQATFDETVVTTVEARVRPGAEEKRFEFNADEIADKVVERLEGRKRPATPNKVIFVGNLGRAPGERSFDPNSYTSPLYNILTRSSPTVVPRGNEPYGPQKSSNAKKRPPKKSKE